MIYISDVLKIRHLVLDNSTLSSSTYIYPPPPLHFYGNPVITRRSIPTNNLTKTLKQSFEKKLIRSHPVRLML